MDWTLWLQFTGTGVATVVSFAALFAGVGYFKQGRDQGKLSTAVLLKDQIDALENKVNTQQSEIVELTTKVKELTTAVEDKNKKIGEMMEILQGRDPKMTEFIAKMEAYMTSNIPLLETVKTKTVPTIERLEKYLDKQQF